MTTHPFHAMLAWRQQKGGGQIKLYLVQHGEAAPKSQDHERPLADPGRDDVARVAAFARRAGIDLTQINHSGKRRAAETAAILAERLEPPAGGPGRSHLY